MIICFYVSGHGFGHATRSSRVIAGLLALPGDHQVHVASTAPEFIFLQELRRAPRWSYRSAAVEPEVAQPTAYTVDNEGTAGNLLRFLAARADLLDAEAEWLKSVGAHAVAVDAPFLPCAAARKAGIPAIAITNFTFDAVYEGIHSLCASSGATGDHLDKALENAVRIVRADYAAASALVCLPGHLPGLAPAFDGHSFLREAGVLTEDLPAPDSADPSPRPRLVLAPLVALPVRQPKEAVLEFLGIPPEARLKRILLVNFGGQNLGPQDVLPSLPEGWVALVCGPAAGLAQKSPRLFFPVPRTTYMPDVLSASDVVLGKLGYGTVSECLVHRRPFIYVPRPQFVEETGLEALLLSRETGASKMCAKMDRADFEAGRWEGYVRDIAISSAEYFAGLDDALRAGAVEDYQQIARKDDAHITVARTFLDLAANARASLINSPAP